jgi:coenzyme F420 hydrogenase subunit beta
MNVICEVVDKNLCVGCGICAAVCPKKRLSIIWNERGEYTPVEVPGAGDCIAGCSLCYDVCPAHGKTKNETTIARELYGAEEGIEYKKETGYYLSSYVGFSKDHRPLGASGGMATWLLEKLLTTGKVNAVVAVGQADSPDKLFEFKVCHTVHEIILCSKSAYYPVEVSHVVDHILKNEGSYAFIGLPCVCKAIRLAQDRMPVLRERIKYLLGLTCGHQCSKFFAEYICALSGGDPHRLKSIVFRGKDAYQPASNIKFIVRSSDDGKEKINEIYWKDGVGKAYTNSYFQIPGCFYCDDVFAECADICFMDAWLPEYSKDPAGTSLIIVRRGELDPLLNGLADIKPIDIKRIIASQAGVVAQKQYRRASTDQGSAVLRKDIQHRAMFLQERIMKLKKDIAAVTPEYWNTCDKQIVEFEALVSPKMETTNRYKWSQKWLRLPVRVYSKMQRMFRSLGGRT